MLSSTEIFRLIFPLPRKAHTGWHGGGKPKKKKKTFPGRASWLISSGHLYVIRYSIIYPRETVLQSKKSTEYIFFSGYLPGSTRRNERSRASIEVKRGGSGSYPWGFLHITFTSSSSSSSSGAELFWLVRRLSIGERTHLYSYPPFGKLTVRLRPMHFPCLGDTHVDLGNENSAGPVSRPGRT